MPRGGRPQGRSLQPLSRGFASAKSLERRGLQVPRPLEIALVVRDAARELFLGMRAEGTGGRANRSAEESRMPRTFDLVLRGGIVVNQDGRAGRVVDCRGLHVLPGVIDTQVHFREPGLDHKEDLESGSRAAVLGGVTAVFEMPNTDPRTTSADALADKVRRANHRMHCDFAFWVGGT